MEVLFLILKNLFIVALKDLEGDIARLGRDMDHLKKQLEAETMRRVDAENKLKSKIDEFNFKTQQNEEIIEEMRTHRTVVMQEVGGQLQQLDTENLS